MIFDIEMIKKVYAQFPERVDKARQVVGRPLPLLKKYCIHTYGTALAGASL